MGKMDHAMILCYPPGGSQPDHVLYLALGKNGPCFDVMLSCRRLPTRPWTLPCLGKNGPSFDVMLSSRRQPTRPWALSCPRKNGPCFDVMLSSRRQPTRPRALSCPRKNGPCFDVMLSSIWQPTRPWTLPCPGKNKPCNDVVIFQVAANLTMVSILPWGKINHAMILFSSSLQPNRPCCYILPSEKWTMIYHFLQAAAK